MRIVVGLAETTVETLPFLVIGDVTWTVVAFVMTEAG